MQGTDDLIDDSGIPYVQRTYLDSIGSYPNWYALDINDKGVFKVAPGWFVQVQEEEAGGTTVPEFVDQFHWPVVDVSQISCQQAKPFTNPGGLLSRCGHQLQAYVDVLLPPPDDETTALDASSDATLHRDDRSLNDGAGASLALVPLGDDASNDLVIRFSAAAIEQFLSGDGPTSATLRLSVDDGASDWDGWSQAMTVRPLPDPFVEGNGDDAALDRGTGTGATWYCAADADISDEVRDCARYWTRYRWAVRRRDGAPQLDSQEIVDGDGRTTVRMRWDVTEDVASGIHAWILRRGHGRHGSLAFHSREGAADLRDPTLAPTLLLDR